MMMLTAQDIIMLGESVVLWMIAVLIMTFRQHDKRWMCVGLAISLFLLWRIVLLIGAALVKGLTT